MIGILKISCNICSTQRFLKQLICCGNHTNIIYPDLFIRYCENCFFILNTSSFDRIVDNISETFILLLQAIQLQCKPTVNMTGLLNYFQYREVFFFARGGVQYPRIHSRIIPFYSRNFTFITQEITNTLLKKFECPQSF